MSKTTATITLDQPQPVTEAATFTVTRSQVKTGETLWVRNDFYDADGAHVAGDVSVVYFDPESEGNAVGKTAPFPAAGAHGKAYVTSEPSSGHPISRGADISYEVSA